MRLIHRAAGHTLLEVLVAMIVGGMVIGSGVTLALAVQERKDMLNTMITGYEHVANSTDLLLELGASADLYSHVRPVVGDRSIVQFASRCAITTPDPIPCTVELTNRPGLAAVLGRMSVRSHAATFVARTYSEPSFLFLRSSEFGGDWVESWNDELPPRALGVAAGGDTIVVPLGVEP